MKILGNRVLVSKVEEQKKEGEFHTVDIQDSFVYKGKVEMIGTKTFHRSAHGIYSEINSETTEFEGKEGDIVLFAKYSPDTQEIDYERKKMKIIKVDDILAIL